MGMVGHAPSLQDERPDASEGPPLGGKSGWDGPPLEDFEDLVPLSGRPTRWTTGLGTALEGNERLVALTQPFGPLADGPRRDAHAPGDLGLQQFAGQEQPTGLQAAFFLLLALNQA